MTKDVFIYSRDDYTMEFLSGSTAKGTLETRVVPANNPQDNPALTVEYVFYQAGCTELYLTWDLVQRRNYFEDIDDTHKLAPEKVIAVHIEEKREHNRG